MQTQMLKAKLHKVVVTHSELEYEGSCAIDSTLLDIAGIREFEQIQIYNIDNGERFTTYAIKAEHDSGIISINGAAAHKASPGQRVIICAFVSMDVSELANFQPTLVYFEKGNRVSHLSAAIPTQMAVNQ